MREVHAEGSGNNFFLPLDCVNGWEFIREEEGQEFLEKSKNSGYWLEEADAVGDSAMGEGCWREGLRSKKPVRSMWPASVSASWP